MTEILRRNPLITGLAILCAVLLAVLVLEGLSMGRGSRPEAPRKLAAAEAKLLPPVASVPAEAAYPETASRPLWIPTRRPAPPQVVQQAAFNRGQFVLHGVIIVGNTKTAMLKEKATGRIHRVEQGRELNGLQVAEVEPGRVTLQQGGEREVIDMTVQKAGSGAGPAAGAPVSNVATQSQGPFGTAAPVPGGNVAFTPPAVPGVGTSAGPLSPGGPVPSAPAAPAANPSPEPVPQPQSSTAPMTPEELLARRRARRNQTQ